MILRRRDALPNVRMATLSSRIVETFLILSCLVHFMDFCAFFDAGKTLSSVEPTRSLSDENESAVVDIWTEKFCCRERSGTSRYLADGLLNPVTSWEDSANKWFGSSATEKKRVIFTFNLTVVFTDRCRVGEQIYIMHLQCALCFFLVSEVAQNSSLCKKEKNIERNNTEYLQ